MQNFIMCLIRKHIISVIRMVNVVSVRLSIFLKNEWMVKLIHFTSQIKLDSLSYFPFELKSLLEHTDKNLNIFFERIPGYNNSDLLKLHLQLDFLFLMQIIISLFVILSSNDCRFSDSFCKPSTRSYFFFI